MIRVLILLTVVTAGLGAGYLNGPPPAHTGGFGEPTCHFCHFNGPLNDSLGILALQELPNTLEPGRAYPLSIQLTRPEMGKAGIELAVRYTESGLQAGDLRLLNNYLRLDGAGGIQYLTHTPEGAVLTAPDTALWHFEWAAPDSVGGIVFHLAANAANGDNSELGDAVYTLAIEF